MKGKIHDKLIERFITLGGKFQNVTIASGQRGRGLFKTDHESKHQVFTPKQLILPVSCFNLFEGEITIDSEQLPEPRSKKVERLIYDYYNQLAFEGIGIDHAKNTVRDILSMPEQIKKLFTRYRVFGPHSIQGDLSSQDFSALALHMFLNSRTVLFNREPSIAPFWDLINHDSYALPFRVTAYGISSPPNLSKDHEVLQRYSRISSSLQRWLTYGFFSKEFFVFSLPLKLSIKKHNIDLQCIGEQTIDDTPPISYQGNILSIRSLPIGCELAQFTLSYIDTHISKVLGRETSMQLVIEVSKANVQVREDWLCLLKTQTRDDNYSCQELARVLLSEIDMIKAQLKFIRLALSSPE